MEISHQDFKAAVIKILQPSNTYFLKTNKRIKTLARSCVVIKKQMIILELINIITISNTHWQCQIKIKKKDKGRISGLEEGTTKLTHSEQHRKNSEKIKWPKPQRSLEEKKSPTISVTEGPRRKTKGYLKTTERVCESILTDNFSNWTKGINSPIKKAEWTQNGII